MSDTTNEVGEHSYLVTYIDDGEAVAMAHLSNDEMTNARHVLLAQIDIAPTVRASMMMGDGTLVELAFPDEAKETVDAADE